MNRKTAIEAAKIIKALMGYAQASKILTTFIPAFENAQQLPDGSWRLYGNFNLGGAQSLRLSSSSPNLQNIPSGSKYAKIIKQCFKPNQNWLFIGSDFAALEDITNALITKDPNKLAVYEQGFCGHCMRAQAYFSEQMPDIVPAKGNDKCFKIRVNGQLLYCKSGDFIVDSFNTKIPVEEYYEKITSKRL